MINFILIIGILLIYLTIVFLAGGHNCVAHTRFYQIKNNVGTELISDFYLVD